MRSIQSWFDEYGESHRNETNTLIHWICVPTIFFSVAGLLYSIAIPTMDYVGELVVHLAMLGVVLFYAARSLTLGIGMATWCMVCLWGCRWLHLHAPWPLWVICLVLFTAAWIGQFIGHRIEGKKPSFLKDLQFLLIGPAWLMAKLYRRLGIPV